MEREHIENLLTEYTNGEISSHDKHRLEKMFKEDPLLKNEANEMAIVWHSLDKEVAATVKERMDKQFYSTLQTVKDKRTFTAIRVLSKTVWLLRIGAAVAACITAFVIGRSTSDSSERIIYKKVYLKSLDNHSQNSSAEPVKVTPSKLVSHKSSKRKSYNIRNKPIVEQQILSLYTSERIAAVISLTQKSDLNSAELKMLERALKEDPSPNVRLSIIDAVKPLITQPKIQELLISALNYQNDALLQESIVDLLLEVRSKKAIPQLITLLEDRNTTNLMQHKIKEGIETFLN